MGGNSGGIIIQRRLRDAAADSVVQDHCHPGKLARLNEILAKSDGTWTHDETHFVMRRIMEAYDELCE